MTLEDLSLCTGLYARYIRLTTMEKRTLNQNKELKAVRQSLIDLGVEIT